MEASSEPLKVNHHYLKACILYEVLQKKPIFDSYRNFCDTVGKDAMEYPDFEFWYYRFYHGNYDFDYDRSVDPEPKTLVDMPVVLMNKIAKYLDAVERTLLRSTNRTIKTVAASFPPVFENIQILVSDQCMRWTLNNKKFSCRKERRGCSLRRPNCSTEKSKKCHIEKGLEYLAPVLKIPNIQVNHLSLRLYEETLTRDDLLPVSFNAKSVDIYSQNINKVVQFLSVMNPGFLESISLDGRHSRENNRKIFKTDQFKQAKSVIFKPFWDLNVYDLAIFAHLNSFECSLTSNNEFEDLLRIRDTVSTFTEFESCKLSFRKLVDGCPMKQFAEALGEPISIGPSSDRTITHRYQIPESNDCLEFKIREEEYRCLVNIVKVR
ncbi:hypothetical protein B9Z55_026943 [Caenorhabditis nigoni]|uniref:F-box domain-containing protein n=1 Tax=Caenorhabditis nigoni TaxID=1611254 RepID=A0A2G5SI58_9PELO|nr:hypothetical protein B9Z55_026943 [Caenorhabditis nigoni]